MSELAFDKYQGLGNDFVLLDGDAALLDPADAELVRRLCDRRFGVGADGLLLAARPHSGGALRMVYYNADGSFAETCFNGLRCIALHAARTGRVRRGEEFIIESPTGDVRALVEEETDIARIELAGPSFVPAEVPILAEAEVIDAELEFSFGRVRGTALAIGNPHFVVWREGATLAQLRKESEKIGGAVERAPLFPRATNLELASVVDGSIVRMAVWERGVGPTLACGSGATATVCAGVREGRLPAGVPVKVLMAGGELTVAVAPDISRVIVVGGAAFVFSGSIEKRVIGLEVIAR